MWPFKKKVSQDDFIKFKNNVKISFQRYKKNIKLLKQRSEFLYKELNKEKPLSERFSELSNGSLK
jgi:hypothetical protein